MAKFIELVSRKRPQYLAYLALSFGVLVLTGLGYFVNNLLFARFLGSLNPLLVVLAVVILGLALSYFLLSRNWVSIFNDLSGKEAFRWSGLALLFGIIAILADLRIVFPADMNVLFPESLLIYPAIAFVVEILFHVLPLSMSLFVLTSVFNKVDRNRIIWIAICIVSMLEPVFQISIGSWKEHPAWAPAWVGVHVFLINLSQLVVFKRHGFVSMFSFRLLYYAVWHIAWGYVRLKILF